MLDHLSGLNLGFRPPAKKDIFTENPTDTDPPGAGSGGGAGCHGNPAVYTFLALLTLISSNATSQE